MIALDRREEALAAGDWVRRWIDANRVPMAEGQLFTLMTTAGELVTDVEPGQNIAKIVDRRRPKQEFWHVGTAMAYLSVLYDTMKRLSVIKMNGRVEDVSYRRLWFIWLVILGGVFAVLQAPVLDGLSFDPFSFQ